MKGLYKRFIVWIFALGMAFDAFGQETTLLYVKQGGAGDKSGNSWANAADNLNAVLDIASQMQNKPTIWVAEGTYYGDGIAENNAFTMVEGVNVYGGFAGTETELSQRDIVNHPTILDGQNVQRVLCQPTSFTVATATVWDGFVIEKGRLTTDGNYGAGVYGAGAYLRDNATLRNCIIRNDTITGSNYCYGAGVSLDNSTLEDCEIYGNYNNGPYGGGVAVFYGNVINCVVHDNYSREGGGVYAYNTALVSKCFIHHNNALWRGGGVYTFEESYTTIIDCRIENNSASQGGSGVFGFYAYLTNCIIANNRSTGVNHSTSYRFAGAIYCDRYTHITNCAVVNNVSDEYPAGIYSTNGRNTMTNTVVWGNRTSDGISNIYSSIAASYSAIEGGFVGTGNLDISSSNTGNELSPMFTAPTVGAGVDYSGGDWTLQEGSILINRGDNSAAYLPDHDYTDGPRIRQDVVDIGPYETPYNASFTLQPDENNIVYVTVEGAGNKDGSSWANASNNLNMVMMFAPTMDPVPTVWVKEGVYIGDGVASNNAFKMAAGVNVFGGFTGTETSLDERPEGHRSTLDGQHVQRVLYQPTSFSSADASTWDGFIIENGFTSGSGAGAYLLNNGALRNCVIRNDSIYGGGDGGGVYLSYGSLVDCEVYGNKVISNGYTYTEGGGVFANYGTVTNCYIHDNYMENLDSGYNLSGAAYVNGGGLYTYNNTMVTGCTICNNISSYGGGVYGNGTFTNCRIENNLSRMMGGGVYSNGSMEMKNCLIANNTSNSHGGGVYINGSYSSFINCDIVNNLLTPRYTNLYAAGLYLSNSSNTITNTIIWGNMRSDTIPDQYYFGNQTPSVTFCAIQGGYDGTGNIVLDAENDGSLSPFFNNPTAGAGRAYSGGDWTLLEESYCINQGTSDVTLPETDLAGNQRVQMGAIDMGAFESPYNAVVITPDEHGIVYVTVEGAGNKDGSSWDNATDNLQLAVNRAGASGPDTRVWVAQGTYHGKTEASENAFVMPQNIHVYGGFVGIEAYDYDLSQRDLVNHATILDGQGSQRVLCQRTNFTENTAALWDGFSLTNGGGNLTGAGAYIRSWGELRNCRIYGNAPTGNNTAGVVANGGALTNCRIYDNEGYNGGVFASSATLTNCLIEGNTGTYSGGLYLNNYTKVLHCGIYNNTVSGDGATVYVDGSGSVMKNTVVWGNQGKAITNPDNLNASYSAIEGGFIGVGNVNLPSENTGTVMSPCFTDPASGDWTLQPNSILINKGVLETNSPSIDLAGNDRVQQALPDMGPFESAHTAAFDIVPDANGIVHVSLEGTGDGSSWANACGDLQFAINRAAAKDPVLEIWVKEGVYYTSLINTLSAFFIAPGVNVYGGFTGHETTLGERQPWNHPTFLDGENTYRVLYQKYDFTAATAAVWDGFTIRNGFATQGGGAYLQDYSTLRNCVVKDNRCYNYGSGIYARHAKIVNCEVSNNHGGYNALYAYYSDIISSTIVNNDGSDRALYMEGGSNTVCTNLIVWGNSGSPVYSQGVNISYSAIQGWNSSGTNIGLNAENDGEEAGNYIRFIAPEMGIYQLGSGSAVIGLGNAEASGLPDKDLAGHDRVIGGAIEPGAYEQYCTEYVHRTIHAGSSYDFYGTTITEPGRYMHQFGFSETCDSLIVADITMASAIWYVTATGTGDRSGRSWENASNDLNGIMAAAAQTQGFEARQVWVAGGIYHGNATGNGFNIVGGVAVYGGFAGNESLLGERNPEVHPTILNGADNQVLLAASAANPCTAERPGFMDGFVMQGGWHLTVDPHMVLRNCTIKTCAQVNGTLWRCEFTGFNDNANRIMLYLNSGAVMDSCTVHHNVCRAALVRADNSTITRSLFYNNTCSRNDGIYGDNGMMYGAILNAIDNVTIDHCDFVNNLVEFIGNVSPSLYVNMEGSSTYAIRQPKHTLIALHGSSMTNSIVWGNAQDLFNNTFIAKDLTSHVDYCAIEGGFYNGVGNIHVTPGNESGLFSVAFNVPTLGAGQLVDRDGLDWGLKNTSICLKQGSDGTDIGAISSESPAVYDLTPSAQHILFVDAQGTGDGSSWENATPYLQFAVAKANTFDPIPQVWVKEGTYTGLEADSLLSAFSVVEGVSVYGGFAGTETAIADRDLANHATILDGGHRQRVLFQNEPFADDRTALWDGFVIRNGFMTERHLFEYNSSVVMHEHGSYNYQYDLVLLHGAGAALLGNAILRNTEFQNNRIALDPQQNTSFTQITKGSAMSIVDGSLDKVTIAYDTTEYVDGWSSMVNTYLYAINAQMESCDFNHNIGKMAMFGCTVNGSRFENNQVCVELPEVEKIFEAQLYADASSFSHCFFRSNNATVVNHNFYTSQYGNTYTNCQFDHNHAVVLMNHSNQYNDTFVNCNICNNKSNSDHSEAYPISGGIFHNSVVWGNRNYLNQPIHFRYYNLCTLNHCAVEMGAGDNDDVIVLASNNMGNSEAYAYPRFLAPEAGDYELVSTSDLLDQGDESVVNYGTDMLGQPRVNDGTVDIGAYEYQCIRYREFNAVTQMSQYPFYGEWLTESGQYVHRWHLNNIDCDSVVVLNLSFKHIIYVKENGGGQMNGKSWENAYADLSLALEEAGQNPLDKTQVWVAEGLYRGDGTSVNAFKLYPNVELYGGLTGTELADYDLSQRDIENHVTILDGDYIQRVIYMTEDCTEETANIIDGFTIKNGFSRQGVGEGTAMYLKRYCHVRNCKITENYTWDDVSAIHIYNDYAGATDKKVIFNTFENCEITENQGEYAVFSDHTKFTNCNISSNRGHGLYVVTYTKLDHCDIVSNDGRGIALEGARYHYTDPVWGIELRSRDFLELDGCLIKKNNKGGIRFIDEDCEKGHAPTYIVNTIFDGNTAKSSDNNRGGAIYNDSHDIYIINSTILKNSARDDGGAFYGTGYHIVNSILSGNTAGGKVNQLSNHYYNDKVFCMFGNIEQVDAETCDVTYSAVEGGYPGEGNIAVNNTDLILNLNNNYVPKAGSVCINNGTTEGFTVPEYDRAGVSRVRQGRIDIGAYETNMTGDALISPDANNIIYVSLDGTGDGSSWENATSHLQMAMNFAPCFDPIPQVWVKGGLYDNLQTDNVQFWSNLAMMPGVNVYGSFNGTEQTLEERVLGMAPTILDGNYTRRVVEQLRPFTNDERAVWDGFVIKNGYGHQGYFDNIKGMSQDRILKNFKDRMYGGGVLLRGGVSLDNSEIRDNVAYRGGGVYRESCNSEADYLRNDKICHNYAIEEGGGLFFSGRIAGYWEGYNMVDTIANCEISDNTSDRHGGMIAHRTNLIDCSIVHNTTEIYSFDTITSENVYNRYVNCLLWGNDSRNYAFQTEGHDNIYEYCAIQGGHEGVGNIRLEVDNTGDDPTKHYANLLNPEEEVYRPTDASAFIDLGSNERSYGELDLAQRTRVNGEVVDMGAYENACINYEHRRVITTERYQFYGTTLTASGHYQHQWTPEGSVCDSLVSLDLEIRHIIYVTEYGSGNKDGSSWHNAMSDLNQAMKKASQYQGDGDKLVWVAAGTYSSATGTGNQAFTLYPDVMVYGGFPANVTDTTSLANSIDIDDRNLEHDHTVLLGNSVQRVVGNSGLESQFSAVNRGCLDGFVIQNGYTIGNGGGVYAQNFVTVRNCSIHDNQAGDGAGLYVTNHSQVYDCDIYSNTALNTGGGAYVESSMLNYCHLHNNLCDNTGSGGRKGGGIFGVNATINNCLIDNNSVLTDQGYGGGMYIGNSTVPSQLLNCTMVNNYSYYLAGGIYSENSGSNNEFINCVLWGNRTDLNTQQIAVSASNVPIYLRYCAVQGGAAGIGTIKLSGTNDDGMFSPRFVSPSENVGANYGGGDWHFVDGSILANHGERMEYTLTHDLDSKTNPRVKNNRVDIGAYESDFTHDYAPVPTNNVIYVDRTNTNSNYVGDSWENAIPDLQFAINFAGDDDNRPDIWIAEGIYYGNGWPYVDAFVAMNGVNLYGGFAGHETSLDQRIYGAHPTILDGQNIQRTLQQAQEDYFKYRRLEELQYAKYDGLTIRNGFVYKNSGAGVRMYYGVLSNSIVENCFALEGNAGGMIGAAKYDVSEARNTVFRNNKVDGGNGGAAFTIQSFNCLFANNSSLGGYGGAICGGIHNNATIVNNYAAVDGGGMDGAVLYNCIVWGNKVGELNQPNSITVTETNATVPYAEHYVRYSAVEGSYGGEGNITLNPSNDGNSHVNYPRFENPTIAAGYGYSTLTANGEAPSWKLMDGSICINHGSNTFVSEGDLDLDRDTRIQSGMVDMGCYETSYNTSYEVIPDANNIIYVTQQGSGSKDGSSWSNATPYLQFAMERGATYSPKPDIWIASGTYTGNGVPYFPAFLLPEFIDIYGGFEGNEPANFDLAQRDFDMHPTIFDGQNLQQILRNDGGGNNQVISGITFQNGRTSRDGGAAFLLNSVIEDCKFVNNSCIQDPGSAAFGGGALYGSGTSIYRSEFTGNYATVDGGAINGARLVDACKIHHNTAEGDGGGIAGASEVFNTEISFNHAGGKGGGLVSGMLKNCTVVKNTVDPDSDGGSSNGGGWLIGLVKDPWGSDVSDYTTNCIFWGNRAGSVVSNLRGYSGEQPVNTFTYCAFENDERVPEGTGNIILESSNDGTDLSLHYVRFNDPDHGDFTLMDNPQSMCIDAGNNASAAPGDYDLAGNNRIINGIIDMGCYEQAPVDCHVPINLEVPEELLTFTTADVIWTPGADEEEWLVYFMNITDGLPETTIVDTNYVQIQSLHPNQEYMVKVRSICDGGLMSSFTPTVYFTTACNPDSIVWSNQLEEDGLLPHRDEALPSNSEVLFSWDYIEDVDYYNLYLWRTDHGNGLDIPDFPVRRNIRNNYATVDLARSEYDGYGPYEHCKDEFGCDPEPPLYLFQYGDTDIAYYAWYVEAHKDCGVIYSDTMTFNTGLPDLHVSALDHSYAQSGQTMTVSWTVRNDGNVPTPTGATWNDYVVVSYPFNWTTESFTSARPEAWILDAVPNLLALDPEEQYTNSCNVTIPDTVRGSAFLFVISNWIPMSEMNPDVASVGGVFPNPYNPSYTGVPYYFLSGSCAAESFHELHECDNFFYDTLNIQIIPYPDLVADSIIVSPSEPFAGDTITVSWTLTNNGKVGFENRPVRDEITMNVRNVYDGPEMIDVGQYGDNLSLMPGETIRRTARFVTSELNDSTYFFFVKTDITNQVYESLYEYNNISVPQQDSTVFHTPNLPDLRIDSLYYSCNVLSPGEEFILGYDVYNDGLADAKPDPSLSVDSCGLLTLPPFKGVQWNDRVYISTLNQFSTYDSERILNVVNDTILYKEINIPNLLTKVDTFAWCVYPDPLPPDTSATHADSVAYQQEFLVQQQKREQFIYDQYKNYRNRYRIRKIVTVPESCTEQWYYLYATTDYNNSIHEKPYDDNNMIVDSIRVVQPDLVITHFELNATRDTVHYSVANIGLGKVVRADMVEKVFYNNANIVSNVHEKVSMLPGDTLHYDVPVSLVCNFYDNNTMRLYVEVSTEKTLTNNTETIDLYLPNPDFEAYGIDCPTELNSGQTFDVTYQMKNMGNEAYQGTVQNAIYLGYSPELNFITAIPLNTMDVDVDLGLNESMSITHHVALPISAEGDYFVYVSVNDDEAVCEGDDVHFNYIVSDSVYITLSPYPDLTVTTATPPEAAGAGDLTSVSFEVINQGIRNIEEGETWVDHVYISNYPQFDVETSTLIQAIDQQGPLNMGATYSETVQFTVPLDLSSDNYFIYIVNDAEDDFYEYVGEYNNVYQTTNFPVTAYQLDIAVTAFDAPAEVEWNEEVSCSFTVQNLGTRMSYPQWTDKVYLSSDETWDTGDKQLVSSGNGSQLDGGESYEQHLTITIPYGYIGTYYLLAVADVSSVNPDLNHDNNVMAVPVNISSIPVPDLEVSEFACITEYPACGQPIKVVYKVTNVGDGPTEASYFNRVVYSRNSYENGYQVISKLHAEVLQPNEYYYDTVEMIIPVPETGNYAIYAHTNHSKVIYEMNTENNLTMIPLTVNLNAPGDLIVTNITRPNTISAGESVTVTWTVKNLGPNTLDGVGCSDVVYLSTDTVFDVDDKLLGKVDYDMYLEPYSWMTNSLETSVTGLPEGEYYIIVITDGRNTFYESNEDNNIYSTPNPFVLELPILYFDHPVTFTLDKLKYKDFKLPVGYAISETALITITTSDSLAGAVNNIYVLHNGIGSNLNFDYSTDGQMAANSELYIPRTQSGYYGVSIFGQSPANETQEVTVLARILPFEVRSISPNQGGNIGEVTVKLIGSKFRHDMPVRLIKQTDNETYVIEGKNLQCINFNKAFVTFDLTDAPLGMYSLVAENYCAGSDTLHNCFEVVEGVPGLLVTNLMIPEGLRANRYTILTLEFGNIGNVDIPSGTAIITSIDGSYIGLRRGELNIHRTEVTVPLKVEGDPANVLRPGVRGTISIYCYTNGGLKFRVEEMLDEKEK